MVSSQKLFLICHEENDLCRVLAANGIAFTQLRSVEEAVRAAAPGAGIMVLADKYPLETTPIPAAIFAESAGKKLRLYIEYPAALPGMPVGDIRQSSLERGVVVSEVFGGNLPPRSLLAIHDCHFVTVPASKSHIVIAKVAGYDTAVYGLEGTEFFPILFELAGHHLLVSTTKLSQFVSGRFGPQAAFQSIWKYILRFLQPEREFPALAWQPAVRPTYGCGSSLPPNAHRQAVIRGLDWHTHARMLIHPAWLADYEEHRIGKANQDGTIAKAPDADLPVGDGSCGMLEGLASSLDWRGNQKAVWWRRSDCNGESALAFALRTKLDGDIRSRTIAANLLDWVYHTSGMFEANPDKSSYGLLRWAPDNFQALYQDNDVRVMLGCIGTAALLDTDRWNERLLLNILANFRTTGRNGFRGVRIELPELEAKGWRSYRQAETVLPAPHYEGWVWAMYLWLYHKTGYKPLLELTRKGIGTMMQAYPDRWIWTNGLQQERGRMLLTLAWLVRVEDSPEHRNWLKRIFKDLMASMASCGAIREELGALGKGTCAPPVSNAAYGKTETSLIQANGDPAADLLYTCNFAFLGLHEAFAATGDAEYANAADRLADFLVRIQIRSECHPELDGGWFRSFDFAKWEYWSANSDSGWGAWCIETGWVQGWIPAVLALRELNLNLWDLSKSSCVQEGFDRIRKEMLPDGTVKKLIGK